MTTIQNSPVEVVEDRSEFIHEQVNEAWEFVCLGFSATLPSLLAETRKRGLTDAEVKDYLQENESEGDGDFRAWRSESGESFIARNQGNFGTVASVNELFSELSTTATTERTPANFVLSATLRAHGDELTEAQALVVDVAQKLDKDFMQRKAVSIRQLKRILQFYHQFPMAETGKVINELVELGIVTTQGGDGPAKEIRLVKKFKGHAGNESHPEKPGVGEWVKTLREKAEDFEFRHDLLKRAASCEMMDHTDCSVPAALLLFVFAQKCRIDQLELEKLTKGCEAIGMTKAEICCACGELEGMGVMFFFWQEDGEVSFARTQDQIGRQYETPAAEVLNAA